MDEKQVQFTTSNGVVYAGENPKYKFTPSSVTFLEKQLAQAERRIVAQREYLAHVTELVVARQATKGVSKATDTVASLELKLAEARSKLAATIEAEQAKAQQATDSIGE